MYPKCSAIYMEYNFSVFICTYCISIMFYCGANPWIPYGVFDNDGSK